MTYEIIDFHTHPFLNGDMNICIHKEYCNMSSKNTIAYLKGLGISKICGSVIYTEGPAKEAFCNVWDNIRHSNDAALRIKEQYGDFYIPGFHVHPDYVKESCDEIEKMHQLGIHLIGELVPYSHGWSDLSCKGFDEILDVAGDYGMVVSIHSPGSALELDQMDEMVKKHPDITFIAAHPGNADTFARHLNRMKLSENYYLDLSGTGLFRHGLLRHGIDAFGAERFLYGSDYPVCNPAMFIGGVMLDSLITEEEKKLILAENAKRILSLS